MPATAIKSINNNKTDYNIPKITFEDISPAMWQLALKRYRQYPMEYIDDLILPLLNCELTESQREVIRAIFKYKKVLIPTHHAFGKSFICAIVAITIANLYSANVKGTTIAPTFRQVQDILWAEMRSIFEKVNKQTGQNVVSGKMTLTRYDISADAFVVGVSPRKAAKGAKTPELIQGTHANVVFVIGDEAGGLDRQIYEQVEGITNTGGEVYVIYIGNPLNRNSEFGQMCLTAKGEGFMIIHKTAYDAPNMKANGLTSLKAIRKEADMIRALPKEKRMEIYENKTYKLPAPFLLAPGWVMKSYIKWGESPLFFSKAIGEWVDNADDCLVPLSRVDEIMQGTYNDTDGKVIWQSEEAGYAKWNGNTTLFTGIDCSGEGADKNVLFTLEGNREYHFNAFNKTYKKDNIDFKGTRLEQDGKYIAKYIYDNIILPNPNRQQLILIDCTGGYGNSIYEALTSYDLNSKFIKVRKVNFAEKASDSELYSDIIAEMAYGLANQIMSEEGLLLKENDDLKNQITNRKKEIDSKMRNKLESKSAYKQRAGSSPDEFDALMMAVYASKLGASKNALSDAIIRAAKIQSKGFDYGKDKY